MTLSTVVRHIFFLEKILKMIHSLNQTNDLTETVVARIKSETIVRNTNMLFLYRTLFYISYKFSLKHFLPSTNTNNVYKHLRIRCLVIKYRAIIRHFPWSGAHVDNFYWGLELVHNLVGRYYRLGRLCRRGDESFY